MWPVRIALARLRPIGFGVAIKIAIVATLFASFVALDYTVFRRLFRAAAQIEAATPFFALSLIENFIGLVFFTALFVLFSSSLTSAIGAFFADFDLETYHAAPVSRTRIVVARWAKSFVQSSYVVIAFIAPMFAALAAQYGQGVRFVLEAMGGLFLLLAVPVSLACTAIILLVRFFPVRRVHQVAATFAILFMTLAVVAMRMSRPERLFATVTTDEVVAVLKAIELPSRDLYPSSWLAAMVISSAQGDGAAAPALRLGGLAAGAFLLFLLVARAVYFRSYVRARESSSPTAIGAREVTSWLDRLTRRLEPQARAMIAKEVRVVSRDAAQWSQLFMMIALLFLYLYNIQMIPLEGDARAAVLAYLNLGMAGFVIGAICLRFAYPSVTAEGKQFWVLASAPISFRRLLWVKVFVYCIPLLGLGIVLTALANFILNADGQIWAYTLFGSILVTTTLVCLGIGMGAFSPDFKLENPLEAALSLGGFAYMSLSMIYVGAMMFLIARPVQRYVMKRIFGFAEGTEILSIALPLSIAVALSIVLSIVPIEIAHHRFRRSLC